MLVRDTVSGTLGRSPGRSWSSSRRADLREGAIVHMDQKIGWSTIASRALLYSLVWWVLSDGSVASWWIGVPAVSLAVIASTTLLPPAPLVWRELIKFVPLFLLRSLLGATDVARRAFHPRLPIAPQLVDYPLRLPAGLPRVMLLNIVNLLPGTLSAELDRQVLKVHVLDSLGDVMPELETLERHVARISGVPLATSRGDE